MMKLATIAVLLGSFAPLANAQTPSVVPADTEVITCVFTEPFFSLKIDRSVQAVKVSMPAPAGGETEVEAKGVTFALAGTVLTLTSTSPSRTDTMTVDFSKGGSDGMSDRQFPYEGVFTRVDAGVADASLYGGCYTPSNPPVDPAPAPAADSTAATAETSTGSGY